MHAVAALQCIIFFVTELTGYQYTQCVHSRVHSACTQQDDQNLFSTQQGAQKALQLTAARVLKTLQGTEKTLQHVHSRALPFSVYIHISRVLKTSSAHSRVLKNPSGYCKTFSVYTVRHSSSACTQQGDQNPFSTQQGAQNPSGYCKTLQHVHSRALPFSVYTAGYSKLLQLTAGCSKPFRVLKTLQPVLMQQGTPFSVYTAGQVLKTPSAQSRVLKNPSACTQQDAPKSLQHTAGYSKTLQLTAGYSKPFRVLKNPSVCTQQSTQKPCWVLKTLKRVHSMQLGYTEKLFSVYTARGQKSLQHTPRRVLKTCQHKAGYSKTLQHVHMHSNKKIFSTKLHWCS